MIDTKLYDKDIRQLFYNYVKGLKNYKIVEELNVSNSRLDLLLFVNGMIIGYEIKSCYDTHKNLNKQILDYNKICDYVYVISNHKCDNNKIGVLNYDNKTLKLIKASPFNNESYVGDMLKILNTQELGLIYQKYKHKILSKVVNNYYKFRKWRKIELLMNWIPHNVLKSEFINILLSRKWYNK